MNYWKYLFTLLILIILLLVSSLSQLPGDNLHIIACDVGQGDALLLKYKNTQILTDGGPNNRVLDCLGRHVPFWDRDLELVILTHPDADHLTGLIDVFENYDVSSFLTNSIDPGTKVYGVLRSLVGGSKIRVLTPVEGTKIRLGKIYLDILAPTGQVLGELTENPSAGALDKYKIEPGANLYSIVYHLSFGSFDGLFTGDIPPEVADSVALKKSNETFEYIKIPHHGSKNGTTVNLLRGYMPGVAVISLGKNSYGHPHKEVLDMLEAVGAKVYRTDLMGDVEIVTNGEKYWVE